MTDNMRNDAILGKLLELAAYENHLEMISEFNADVDESGDAVSPRLEKRVRHILRRKETGARGALHALRAAAIALAVFLSISFLGVMTVEAVRREVYSIVVEIYDKFVSVFFGQGSTDSGDASWDIYEPTYIPEGFVFVSEEETDSGYVFTYRGEERKRLTIVSRPLSRGARFSVDGERHSVEPFNAGGVEGITFRVAGNDKKLYLTCENESHAFLISGEIGINDLEKIVDGMRIRMSSKKK